MTDITTTRKRRRWSILCSLVILLAWLGIVPQPVAQSIAPSTNVSGLSPRSAFTVIVEDQDGRRTPGARITVRDPETYVMVGQETTDENGSALFSLDRTAWYVVTIGYREFGSDEMWSYGYILPEDWSPSPQKVVRRQEPWIEAAHLPADPWLPHQPRDIIVDVTHGYPNTNYQLEVRVHLWVDDDGETPYLYQTISQVQSFYDGPLQPYHLAYTPTLPGRYVMRLYVERRFSDYQHPDLPWRLADEGGWQWSLDIAGSAPSPTPSPRVTVPPSPTPTVAFTPTPTPCACSISGMVFEDQDHDGVRDADDPPVPGVALTLSNLEGTPLAEERTDNTGRYAFVGLPCSRYTVQLGDMATRYPYLSASWPASSCHISCDEGQIFDSIDWPLVFWRLRLPLILQTPTTG